ncbi:T6SS immunity protein Tli4 family protein [Burkholderia sp. Ac-20392]|uniref:T6SS immunity protein Tli4 family protein n=1 Tax=Burkholderia sp. Ac-20392 TaxID=2703905 RepID=UPI001F11D7A9|nr:T6SS immunity protein Tli4 family protein [Burkholderia sp. Ac-20392]
MGNLIRQVHRNILPLAIAALGAIACTQQKPSESSMSQPVMTDARPWCIGRFAVDLPHATDVYVQDYKYMGYTIEPVPNVSESEFVSRVSKREQELRTLMREDPHKSFAQTNTPWLHQTVEPSAASRLFVYGRYDDKPEDLVYDVEGYAESNGTLFALKNRFGATYDQSAISNVSEILRNIKPRSDWDVPSDGAFCFRGGAIGGKPMPGFDASIAARLVQGRPSNLVVTLRESVEGDRKNSPLDSLSKNDATLRQYAGNMDVLRKGTREVAGMKAAEVAVHIQGDGIQAYHFYLYSPGVPGDPSKPNLNVQLLFGAAPDDGTPASEATSPVNQAEAMQAWDSVLASFRYRGPK